MWEEARLGWWDTSILEVFEAIVLGSGLNGPEQFVEMTHLSER
jgi:hypothetical protein